MVEVFDRILGAALQLGASDVILKGGLPPIFRVRGELRTLQNVAALARDSVSQFAMSMLNPKQRQELETQLEVDLAYSTADGVRYRCNVFHQRGHLEIVMRVIPQEIPSFESLGLPRSILALADEQRGLVLVTGVTGSGKSTTLAALIEHINQHKASHIVTIEDPIEYVFRDRKSVMTQRELGLDTLSFTRALRATLRQNPDVIFVGEMRDLETIEIALLAAETGHLVFSTLHTTDAVETVNRVIGAFPPHQQIQVRLQLAAALRGVVSQRLVPRTDGRGMVPAVEILVGTARVRELIENPERTTEIRDAMAQGRTPYGMQTFDQSLAELVLNRTVTYRDALRHASRPDDFALYFRGVSKGTSEWAGTGPSGTTGGTTAGPSSGDEFEIIR